jgi:hypothetical protein
METGLPQRFHFALFRIFLDYLTELDFIIIIVFSYYLIRSLIYVYDVLSLFAIQSSRDMSN